MLPPPSSLMRSTLLPVVEMAGMETQVESKRFFVFYYFSDIL